MGVLLARTVNGKEELQESKSLPHTHLFKDIRPDEVEQMLQRVLAAKTIYA